MAQLPLSVGSESIRCLLVGGGAVASRKLDTLLKHGVRCRVVAKEIDSSIHVRADEETVTIVERAFQSEDLDQVNLVVCATNDRSLNRLIAGECKSRNIWVNVVDDRDLSTITFPAIVKRGSVSVSISTDGKSPTLARRLKSQIDSQLTSSIGLVADFIARKRNAMGGQQNRLLWDAVLDSTIPDLLERAAIEKAEAVFEDLVESDSHRTGLVSLVGAGPGDPMLLTIKAVQVMERADIVYYDNLISDEVLDRVRKDAERVYVGKKRRFASIRQTEINELLLKSAQEGKRVVRLKGGDPFLFGRGGEEIESLAANGVDFEVIPGITAALGCAAYAGIPLTHRDYSQSVRFVTGHTKKDDINLDWPELAKPNQTLVVYMGLANLEKFTQNLLDNGMPEETPIAVISRGTFSDQRVITSGIGRIRQELLGHSLQSPTTAIIGEVVYFVTKLHPADG